MLSEFHTHIYMEYGAGWMFGCRLSSALILTTSSLNWSYFPIRTSRHASRNVKVKDDLVIPKGMRVLIPIIALHHSKVFWYTSPPSYLCHFQFWWFFFQFHSWREKQTPFSCVTCLLGGGLVTALGWDLLWWRQIWHWSPYSRITSLSRPQTLRWEKVTTTSQLWCACTSPKWSLDLSVSCNVTPDDDK